MPITNEVEAVLYRGKSPGEAVTELMSHLFAKRKKHPQITRFAIEHMIRPNIGVSPVTLR
jgi:hypothetical protein